MIKEYLDHRLEPKVKDNFRTKNENNQSLVRNTNPPTLVIIR